jgi:hypothetical protein
METAVDEIVRIGCGAGFAGDRTDAAVPVVGALRAATGPRSDCATNLSLGQKPILRRCLVLSNGQEIPGLRNMEQVAQVRTDLWDFTDCLHDIVCYKIRSLWIR